MRRRLSSPLASWLVLSGLSAALAAACSSAPEEVEGHALSAVRADCGREGQVCCSTGDPCGVDLGCARGTCRSVVDDTLAYVNRCKRELAFTNPEQKMAFMSCNDAARADGTRTTTARQVFIRLSLREGDQTRTVRLEENGPPIEDGRDAWDLVFGTNGKPALGCDNPNYLYGRCDPYDRLNVFNPDPGGNPDIVAAVHCRSPHLDKPNPPTAIKADARLRAYESAPAATNTQEKLRLFEQWNATSVIVLTMQNQRTGKACFFHASSPYYGNRIAAPDDETDLSMPDAVARIWSELPHKPPYGPDDASHRSEWLRNGESSWHSPNYMQCTGCHDNGAWMHNPFIDSTGEEYLPPDRRTRPYIPLAPQQPVTYLKTDPVRRASGGTEPQRCTSCHSLATGSGCGSWFDQALGWSHAYGMSEEARRHPTLGRYMPMNHGASSVASYYATYGFHVDAMKCCCEHRDWRGCRTVPGSAPTQEGTPGLGSGSCTASTCGGWQQPCCDAARCNHSGLACAQGTCRFRDEAPTSPP